MIKIAHSSDWHLFNNHKYSVRGSRIEELVVNCKEIIDYSIEVEADAIVIAGDIFHTNNPRQDLVELFIDIIEPALKRGIFVGVIVGQHDYNGQRYSLQSIEKISSIAKMENFKVFPPDEIYGHSLHDKGQDVFVYFASWMENFEDRLGGLTESEVFPNDNVNILVAHGSVLGARTPSGYLIKRGYLDYKAFKDFDYVAFGDFHNYQVIEPNIYYCGAPLRFRWDERDNDLGFNVITIDGGKLEVERVPLVDIAMIDMKIGAADAKKYKAEQTITKISNKLVSNSIIKAKITGRLTDSEEIRFKTALYNSGARQVFTTVVDAGAPDIENDDGGYAVMGIREATKAFAGKNKLSSDTLKYGLEILDEV